MSGASGTGRDPVVVVGAGVAGLACARELARRGVAAVVLERARGVGGRCATRVIEGVPVDFGTPLLHARSREFALEIEALPEAGRGTGWPARVREPRLACQPDAYRRGQVRLARHDGVNEFPRHLAAGLDVRTTTRVVALETDGDRLAAVTEDGARLAARWLVLATHLTMTRTLVEPFVTGWPGAAEPLLRLAAPHPVRTLTVMAGYPADAPEPGFDIWYPLEATMVHTLVDDGSKRAEPRPRTLVIQARERFSDARWEMPEGTWADELMWETAELLGAWAARPLWRRTHRWTCARIRPGHVLGEPRVLGSPGGAWLGLCGDAFSAVSGVEGAYLSGVALAERIVRETGAY